MPQPNVLRIIGKLRPDLITEAERMRAKNKSFDVIARMLCNETGMEVGRETVRRYFAADKVSDEK